MLAPEPTRHADTAATVQTCRYCARREFVMKRHGNNRVWRCVLSDTIIATTDPACRDYDHYDARKGTQRPRAPHVIVRLVPVTKPLPAPEPEPTCCPHCGSGMLYHDQDGLACGACGFHTWATAGQYGYLQSITAGTLPSFLRGVGRMSE